MSVRKARAAKVLMETWISLKYTLDSVKSGTEYDDLDLISQRMLEWIAVRTETCIPLYVQEIVTKSEIASPATVHKSIAVLQHHGLITITADQEDGRRRIVKITSQAEKLLAKLSKGVDAWVASRARVAAGRKIKTSCK